MAAGYQHVAHQCAPVHTLLPHLVQDTRYNESIGAGSPVRCNQASLFLLVVFCLFSKASFQKWFIITVCTRTSFICSVFLSYKT